jgi:hypothetical protein
MSEHLVELWDTAYIALEATEGEIGEESLNRYAARRVAQAIALLNFGPEWLLR